MRSQPRDDFGDIRNRLPVLEKQNRRFKQLAVAGLVGLTFALALLVATTAMGQDQSTSSTKCAGSAENGARALSVSE